jgi:hypothetical protein
MPYMNIRRVERTQGTRKLLLEGTRILEEPKEPHGGKNLAKEPNRQKELSTM